MQYAVQCNEEVVFSQEGDVAAAAAAFPEIENIFRGASIFGEGVFDICSNWGVSEAPAIENQAITSDIPASWGMEGGDIFPEPGEEAEWLEKHEAKHAAEVR